MKKFSLCFFAAATAFPLDTLGLPEQCITAYDVVQVQDMTSSFDKLWPAMARQVGTVLDILYSTNEDSRFGFVTFGDKPIDPLGYHDDYCAKVDVPLGNPSPKEMEELFLKYNQISKGGGNDWEEASLEALARTLISPAVGWSSKGKYNRLLVLVTDAMAHLEGEAERLTGESFIPYALTARDLADDVNAECSAIEYPSFQKVANAISEAGAKVMVVAAPAGTYDEETGAFTPWRQIALEGKEYRGEDGLALWYQDQFAKHGIRAEAVAVDAGMEGYSDAFKRGFSAAVMSFCSEGYRTTSVPAEASSTGSSITDTEGYRTTSVPAEASSTASSIKGDEDCSNEEEDVASSEDSTDCERGCEGCCRRGAKVVVVVESGCSGDCEKQHPHQH